jgi:excisionase family DNA binding protein
MSTSRLESITAARCPGPSAVEWVDDGPALHELLTVDDMAALLKVSKSWVYEHTRGRHQPRADRLPFVKIGKYVRFEPTAVAKFLAMRSRIA